MPEPTEIRTPIIVEDRFSNSFRSLNGSLADATYASQKFEKGFTSSMYNSAYATQNFSQQFNTSFAQVNGTLQQTNSGFYNVNNNNAFAPQSNILTGITRLRNGLNEAKLLTDDISEAFTVVNEHLGKTDGKSTSLFSKFAMARKVLKLVGFDGVKKLIHLVFMLDAFKERVGSSLSSISNSLSVLSQNSMELMEVIRPFIKVASHFVPFLNTLLPYLDQLPISLNGAAESTSKLGEQIESASIPGLKFMRIGEKLIDIWNNPAYKKLRVISGLAMFGGAMALLISRSTTMQNAFKRAFEVIKEKLEEFDIDLMVASTRYTKFRMTMMKFGNLDGAYFGLKNFLSDGFDDLKNKFLRSDIGIKSQFQILKLKKKLDEIDTELMWHSRTYAKFRNKMMEKGFWGAVAFYIKRADSYLINHSETYVKFRKIMNKTFNNALSYYEKNWKNLFTSGKIYLSSFKKDIKEAFLVKDIGEDGKAKFSFLPSYFFKNLTDLETYKNLWAQCREYLSLFYQDMKDTPLGGPLSKFEEWLQKAKNTLGDIIDKFKDWKLTASIYIASVSNYIKQNYQDWILTAKIYFAKFKNDCAKAITGLVEVFFLVRKIYNYMKFLKFSWEGFNLAKEKIGELVQETEYLQKRKAVFVQFGQEAGEEFSRFAEKASLELGKTKDEIIDTGLAFRKFGFSNKSIEDIVNLSDRLEDLNPGQSFQGIRDAFLEAFKSGSSEGLAEFIGGGRGTEVERAMKRLRLDRYLRKGDVQGFLQEFSKLADSFGYTQERADEMDETIHAKLGQVSAHFDRLSEKVKTMFFDRLKPYVDRLLDFLNSPEFQAFFEKISRQFFAIIDIIAGIITPIIDVGVAFYQWWIEPSGEILRRFMMILTMFFVFKKIIAIVRVLSMAFTGLSLVLKFMRYPIKAIIYGFKEAKKHSKGFFKSIKENSAALSAMGSALITGFVVGSSLLFEHITGENYGMLENFVRFVVPGLITGWYKFLNGVIWVWNKVKDVAYTVMQGIIDFVINGVRTIIAAMFPILEIINKIDQFFDDREKSSSILEVQETMLNQLHSVVGDEIFYKNGGGEQMMQVLEKQKQLMADGGKKNRGFLDKMFSTPVLKKFEHVKGYTDEEIYQKANAGLDWALNAKNTVLDAFGLNTLESYQEDWNKLHETLDNTNDHLGHIRKNTKEMDLLWMKQLAEQRFVNNVNVRQLTPNINVKVSGSKSSAEDTAEQIARQLNQMADAGTFNAYGSPA